MQKSFGILLQYMVPQHALSAVLGWFANCRCSVVKNWMIQRFIKRYKVNLQEAIIENPFDYESFNSFFTRHLKPQARRSQFGTHEIISPADGSISQIGNINNNLVLQAKGHCFSVVSLLGGCKKHADLFSDGQFATFYLAPKDYHRVHMPYSGKLRETIFIPGKLFSVNTKTTEEVPELFARNQRLVCLFSTAIGPMAVILVGAMLVGSINTRWHADTHGRAMKIESYSNSIALSQGEELGHFSMGSTVIVLFAKDAIEWEKDIQAQSVVQMGQLVGRAIK